MTTHESDAGLLAALKAGNDEREAKLVKESKGLVMPGDTRGKRMMIYLHHLLIEAGVLERAELDYETQRSERLDEVEKEWKEQDSKMRLGLIPDPRIQPQAGPIIGPGGLGR